MSSQKRNGAFVTLKRLQKIEWVAQSGYPKSGVCPACGQFPPDCTLSLRPGVIGHKPTCWLAAAIKEAEK